MSDIYAGQAAPIKLTTVLLVGMVRQKRHAAWILAKGMLGLAAPYVP